MSCFLVSPKHIACLIQGIPHRNLNGDGLYLYVDNQSKWFSKTDLANVLWKENIKAVNDRYNENNPLSNIPPVPLTFDILNQSRVSLLKLLDCLQYQMSDSITYSDSIACRIVSLLRSMFINGLDGYEDAEWTI